MIDHDAIAPPPSLADILSGGEDLIGRVDFGSRLVPETPTESADDTTATRSRTPRVAAKPTARKADKLAAKPAAKPVEQVEKAEKPAETPVEKAPEPEAVEVPAATPRKRTTPRATAKATLRPTLKRVEEIVEEPVEELEVEAELEELEVEPASFVEADDLPGEGFTDGYPEEYVDELDELEDEDFGYDGTGTFGAPFADPYRPGRTASYQPRTEAYAARRPGRVAARRQLPAGLTAPSVVPEDDVAYLGLSVEEVAESARARMRAAEAAHLRHLEAIENEAARRLELLTAQAELDAELIRLHARREAHAIITAARTRTGAASAPSRAERRLAEVGGSFSRFAETLESTIESSLAPDHRYRP